MCDPSEGYTLIVKERDIYASAIVMKLTDVTPFTTQHSAIHLSVLFHNEHVTAIVTKWIGGTWGITDLVLLKS